MTLAEFKQALTTETNKTENPASEKQIALVTKFQKNDSMAKKFPEYYQVMLTRMIETGVDKRSISQWISKEIEGREIARVTVMAALYR